MYEIKPRIFDGTKLVTVFDGIDTQCYCIGYHMLAKAIVLLKDSIDKAVFVRQYDEDIPVFEERILKMQQYIDENKADIHSMLMFVANTNESQSKEYIEMWLNKVESKIALAEEMSMQLA